MGGERSCYPVVEFMLPSRGSIDMEDVAETGVSSTETTTVSVQDKASDNKLITTQVVVEMMSDGTRSIHGQQQNTHSNFQDEQQESTNQAAELEYDETKSTNQPAEPENDEQKSTIHVVDPEYDEQNSTNLEAEPEDDEQKSTNHVADPDDNIQESTNHSSEITIEVKPKDTEPYQV